MRTQAQIDVYNIEQQRDRETVTQRGGGEGGRYRQIYTTQNMRQRYRFLDREEEIEEVATDKKMYTTSNNRERERLLDREEEEVATDRCIQQITIDRLIVRQRGGGSSQSQMYTTQNNRNIE